MSAEVQASMIFVFGSNLAGRHGAGAALTALREHGAELGVGEGARGLSYALPTKDEKLRTLSLARVAIHVRRFLDHAARHPAETFKVTRVGCGLAGFRNEQIAPLFDGAPPNCLFDEAWRPWLPGASFWGTCRAERRERVG
jgi:hypothetical protein